MSGARRESFWWVDGRGYRDHPGSLERRRRSLFTVFVDNISHRLSWREVKASFDEFEMLKAIRYRSGISLDGKRLKVKQADYPRGRLVNNTGRPNDEQCEGGKRNGASSYKEVFTGAKGNREREHQEAKTVENNKNSKKNIASQGQTSVETIQSAMFLEGVTARVRPAGGLDVLVTFGDKEEMETLLESYSEIFELWFDSISPYNADIETRSYMVWVKVEEIPIHLWSMKLFKALGNSWGKFIRIDHATAEKDRLDHALLQVEVSSKNKIPAYPQIQFNGKIIILSAFIADVEKVEIKRQILATKKGKEVVEENFSSLENQSWWKEGDNDSFFEGNWDKTKEAFVQENSCKKTSSERMLKKSKVMGTLFFFFNRTCRTFVKRHKKDQLL
ncbi:Uncharacterized protein TCM_040863 [Theobroma cacao]|uniref:Uncharacterized protein n=1 Tax=Theobroma cacao TaxID=3641 RepID=A0A061GSL8_THECC|nr:Uncharacterized protein TCM_040863 [Theobroma cacao]